MDKLKLSAESVEFLSQLTGYLARLDGGLLDEESLLFLQHLAGYLERLEARQPNE